MALMPVKSYWPAVDPASAQPPKANRAAANQAGHSRRADRFLLASSGVMLPSLVENVVRACKPRPRRGCNRRGATAATMRSRDERILNRWRRAAGWA